MDEPTDKPVDASEVEDAQVRERNSERLAASLEENPVEVHPPHAAAHSFRDFFIQLGTITAGVLIALSFEGLLEWNHHRLLVREARETLGREIADNRRAVEHHLAGADARAKELETSLQLTKDLLENKKSDIRQFELSFDLPTLNAAGWRSAERTGALAFMEYSDVQKYADLYDVQELYANQLRRLMERTIAAVSIATADESPHQLSPHDLERLRQTLLDLRGELLADQQIGTQLAKTYKELLEPEGGGR